ncbi:monocarboxylate transporter 12 [Ixodes scapularis]
MAAMTVTFGLIYGLGYGLNMLILGVLLALYFDRYRGITSGIMYAGLSCSGLAFPKFLAYLRQEYGFRGTLLIFGAIATHVTAFGLLLEEPPWIFPREKEGQQSRAPPDFHASANEDNNIEENTTERLETFSSLLMLLRRPMFYVVILDAAIADLTYATFTSTMVDYGVDKELSLSDAESLIVYGSCAEIVGRLFVPLVADAGLIRRSTLVMINFFIAGGSLILMPHVTLHTQFLVLCLCVYISLGYLTTMKSVLMADYVGVEWIATCYGASGSVLLPLTLCTPSIIGFFRDLGGSYDNLYRMYGAVQLLLSAVFLTVVCVERRRI